MEIAVTERVFRIQIINLKGRVDALSVPELRAIHDRLLADGNANFVVDLRDLEFLDSAGIAALVSLLKRAREAGGDVVLVRATNWEAQRIFTLTRLDLVFVMADTPDKAIQKLYTANAR